MEQFVLHLVLIFDLHFINMSLRSATKFQKVDKYYPWLDLFLTLDSSSTIASQNFDSSVIGSNSTVEKYDISNIFVFAPNFMSVESFLLQFEH